MSIEGAYYTMIRSICIFLNKKIALNLLTAVKLWYNFYSVD